MNDDFLEHAILLVLTAFTLFSAAGLWHMCLR
jgi:hypothetical protein